ncbi:MAG TPA: acyclic terpene utilization AtuA family protein, partial [Planctomycetota bacterium]|nr:acyclic terpene utilization AtuA family protein [Planctomycetota bacterium]
IEGDDILARIPELQKNGHPLANMDDGRELAQVQDRLLSANAYIGAFAVAECLKQGAQIVIGGRITDPALVGGPMIHEFGWGATDYDKLAASTMAGHIAECGAQCTGGNYTGWREVEDFVRIGYPVIEAAPDGTFVVTKHEGTGGLVTRNTVVSQLLYEMGDPRRYLGPDCTADFTSARIEQVGRDRVRLSGIKGGPPTDTYKVSLSYQNGFKAVSQLTVSGPDALAKARLCADIVWGRLALDGCTFTDEEKLVEYVGAGVCHAGITEAKDPPEVVLRLGVKCQDQVKVDRFGMEVVPLVTSGPPGVTGFAGGRAKATDIVGYWPALLDKNQVRTRVRVEVS